MSGGWVVTLVEGALPAVVALVLFGRFRALPAREPGDLPGTPSLTVVVPARNEEATLPGLLRSLERERTPGTRVIVVDDDSSDETRSVAESFEGIEVVDAAPLPVGWCGKNWACQQGALRAGPSESPDDLLLFLDADVTVGPGALARLASETRSGDAVVSVQPHHTVPTPVEHLSGLFNVVSVMGTAAGTNRPTGLFGPVLCCRTADYWRVGGHASVRSEPVEDLALARRFREHGVPLRTFAGGDGFRFRMYPLGFRQLLEGWTKNTATGASATPLWRALGITVWITALLSAAIEVVRLAAAPTADVVPVVTTYLIAAGTVSVLLRRAGTYRWWAGVAYPVLGVFFAAVTLRSAWRLLVRRTVRWKDRDIAVHAGAILRPVRADLDGAGE